MPNDYYAESWRDTILPLGSTIQQAINSLEKSGLQIVLAVMEGNRLVGTLTDGDIRRAFLRGLKLDSAIDDVINRNPLVVPPDFNREVVLQLMQANKLHQLPVVGDSGEVIDLHVWDTIISPRRIDNLMIIMAGGRGTRMRPHTENCPKPMLEIGGRPMLEHIIERAKSNGFYRFLVSVHYLGEMIEDYFGDGSKFGVVIDYIREQNPLGTAGCLSLILDLPEMPFVVTNGDVLTNIYYNEILDFHGRYSADATMAVRQHEIQNQFGVVKTKGVEIDGFEEKPVYRSQINAGIYVLSPRSLNHLEKGAHCDMPTLFERIRLNNGKAIVYPMHEPWLDVGRPDELIVARATPNYQFRKK